MLVGVVSLLEGEDRGVDDAALLFQSVSLGRERQDGLVVGRQAGEPQLGEIVDEEVELGGHAAQTRLYEPEEDEKQRGGRNDKQQSSGFSAIKLLHGFHKAKTKLLL